VSPPAGNAAAPLPPPPPPLRRAELRAADAAGALVELWGFKRQMGRVWTILYLSERPLTAAEACDRLGISTGLLSMTLADLRAWGAVRTVTVAGERRERYEAEVRVWRLVLRVLGSRERSALDGALRAFEAALAEARAAASDADPATRAAARFGASRLARLAAHTRGAATLLRLLTEAIASRRRR
jgi:DNA-binding transcriptional regulator GbsR (MarR family)